MYWLDFIGVFAFALSGGLAGVRRHFDIVGILVLAVVTALGGGMLRDVLLGITPPKNLTSVPLICTALAGGLVPFWFSGTMGRKRVRHLILVADAAGLGAFAVAGTLAAERIGHPGVEAVAVGVLTAVGGGVVRDMLSGEVASVFTQDLYAIPAFLGSLATDLLVRFHLWHPVVQWLVVGAVFAMRLVARKRGWQAPRPPRPLVD